MGGADSADRRGDLREALAAIVEGSLAPPAVRGEIDASWRRSSAFGLDPERFDVPFDDDLDDESAVQRAARPVLDQLLVDTSDAGVAFVLTDRTGHVLDRRVADGHLLTHLDEVLLAPGFVYAEDAVGTNGIGTTLAERRPTAVAGGEHFAGSLTTFACAAAPVFDPTTRRLVGVVDLTCLAPNASALMLPFARRAAQEIEQRLVDAAGLADRLVLQRYLEQRKRIKGPYVVITERRMLPNAAAARLLGEGDEPLLRQLLRLQAGRATTTVLASGATVTARSEPIFDGGAHVGTVLRLWPTEESSAAADGPRAGATFGWASLTDTERSVTELVVQGLTNRDAAARLFLSHHTVGFHLRSIFRKLEVNSRVDLTRLVVERSSAQVRSLD